MNTVETALQDYQRLSGKTMRQIADEIGVTRVTLATWKRQGYVSEDHVLRFSEVTKAAPWAVTKLAKELGRRFSAA